jgi:hypothetical protein
MQGRFVAVVHRRFANRFGRTSSNAQSEMAVNEISKSTSFADQGLETHSILSKFSLVFF